MYKIYADNDLIYDDSLDALRIYAAKVTMELNVVGSFKFTMYPEHPYYDKLLKLKTIIRVYQNGYLLFRGRILNDVIKFHNEKEITCESELAFFLDSIQRPYEFTGSPEELFRQFIRVHNQQVDAEHQFEVGNVTVTDPNNNIVRSDTTYLDTFNSIKKKLIEPLGGYLNLRYSGDKVYIDYLKDIDVLSSQKIEFSKNLLDMKQTTKSEDIYTVLIPLGAKLKDKDERVSIKTVNDDDDYIEDMDAINKYGRITKTKIWDDVTEPKNLLTKARNTLDDAVLLMNSIELTAADLSSVNKSVTSFHIGTKVRVTTNPHGVDKTFLVNKISIDLLNPGNNKLALDASYTSLTEKQQNRIDNMNNQIVSKVEDVTGTINDIVAVKTEQMQTTIESTSQSILATVSDKYYLKSETDRLIQETKTSIEQTSNSFEMKFQNFNADVTDILNGQDAKFDEISKYIRFIDGKILLGEVGNELELEISNDRITFKQHNTDVAYFSNNKLYVVDGEFTNSLQLGDFAFLPRKSGNLSFKKVR